MRLRLAIDGMLSVHATRAVFMALAGVRGVTSAEVEIGSAIVDADRTVSDDEIRAAIDGVGMRVARITRELPVM